MVCLYVFNKNMTNIESSSGRGFGFRRSAEIDTHRLKQGNDGVQERLDDSHDLSKIHLFHLRTKNDIFTCTVYYTFQKKASIFWKKP